MAIAANVHTPAKKPAVAPQARSVFGSAKKQARFADDIKANSAVKPNVLAMFDFWISSCDSLLSTIHAVPNTFGLYHTPPTAKADNAATNTAGQLINAGFIMKKV